MRKLLTLLILLGACAVAEPPASRTVQGFSCATVTYCDGVETKGNSDACTESREEAEDTWTDECVIAHGQCGEVRCDITCYPTGSTCE